MLLLIFKIIDYKCFDNIDKWHDWNISYTPTL